MQEYISKTSAKKVFNTESSSIDILIDALNAYESKTGEEYEDLEESLFFCA